MLAGKEYVKEAEYLLFVVTGGIGKNLMATAVVHNIKKAYPDKKIVVLCGCPDLFIKNPNVYRVYGLGQPVFVYDDYILGGKTVVMNPEPYHHYDYIYRKKHLIECWCDMLGVPCERKRPEVIFTATEEKMAKLFADKFDKEMVLFQGEGGKIPQQKTEKDKIASMSGMYKRSLKTEIIEKVSEGLIAKNYMVGCVATPNQFLPKGAERINFPIRAIVALIPHVAGIIAIDSFLQHGTAVSQRGSLILWGGTNPDVLGYDFNNNVIRRVCDTPMCHRPNSYLWDFEATGFLWDCPHNDKCMDYTADGILEQFDKMTGGRHGRRKEGTKPEAEGEKCAGCNDSPKAEREAGRPAQGEGGAERAIPAS